MTDVRITPPIEPRWPVALTVFVMLALAAGLPEHHRPVPLPLSLAGAAAAWLSMAGVTWAADKARWKRIETFVLIPVAVMAIGAQVLSLGVVVQQITSEKAASGGLKLLFSGVNIWAGVIISFAVLYWQMDRGGPAVRMEDDDEDDCEDQRDPESQEDQVSQRRQDIQESRENRAWRRHPDWYFPEEEHDEAVPTGWKPAFVAYLFLSFQTATAFSTADIKPLTSRARLLMMLEASICLCTLVVVASRAINVLGS